MLKKTRNKVVKLLMVAAIFGLIAGTADVSSTYASDCTTTTCDNGGG